MNENSDNVNFNVRYVNGGNANNNNLWNVNTEGANNSNNTYAVRPVVRVAVCSFYKLRLCLNARTESLNLFEHIGQNRNFILVMSAVTVIQILIIQFGGKVFGTTPLSLNKQ